jgi:hypothetical protein
MRRLHVGLTLLTNRAFRQEMLLDFCPVVCENSAESKHAQLQVLGRPSDLRFQLIFPRLEGPATVRLTRALVGHGASRCSQRSPWSAKTAKSESKETSVAPPTEQNSVDFQTVSSPAKPQDYNVVESVPGVG